MNYKIYTFRKGEWNQPLDISLDSKKTLVLVFGTAKKEYIEESLKNLTKSFSKSVIVGASSAGEIVQDEVFQNSLAVAIIQFETTTMKVVEKPISSVKHSYKYGAGLATELLNDELKGIFVLSDGLHINGSKLTNGISSVIPDEIIVTGGLAGDDERFESTWVIANKEVCSGFITAVGFYGDNIHIAHGSQGGWDSLGIERIVTKSEDNLLYELDSQPALEIYKRYLGDKAKDLPASGLLFPLEIKPTYESEESTVRTILAIDEKAQSITFAGDIPEGSYVTFMKANYDRIIDGASFAAEKVNMDAYHGEPVLSIAISCVGRRLILKQRTEEELEAVLEVLPPETKQIGFYSYGEISPMASGKCDLHNQTMTLTLIWETDAFSS
jgi:hypothetical protein